MLKILIVEPRPGIRSAIISSIGNKKISDISFYALPGYTLQKRIDGFVPDMVISAASFPSAAHPYASATKYALVVKKHYNPNCVFLLYDQNSARAPGIDGEIRWSAPGHETVADLVNSPSLEALVRNRDADGFAEAFPQVTLYGRLDDLPGN